MPERPSKPTDGKLSTVTVKAMGVEIPNWSLTVVRGIGGVIAGVGLWIPFQAHVLTQHEIDETLAQIGLELVLPTAFIGFGVMLLMFPKATAIWMFEAFNKVIGRLLSWIPSKKK